MTGDSDDSLSESDDKVTAPHKSPDFSKAISQFIYDIGGLRSSSADIMELLSNVLQNKMNPILEPLERHFDDHSARRANRVEFAVKKYSLNQLFISVSEMNRAHASIRISSRSFLNSLVSQFDAFLSRIIYLVISEHPESLLSSDRSIAFAQLSEFTSLDEARSFFIEKQVEGVIRQSHTEHFEWLEKHLEVKLRKGLSVWPAFVEATERRNLFTHNGGIVTRQYLSKVREVNYVFSKCPELGSELKLPRAYYSEALDVFCEIGVKLGHVVWRKIRPNDAENANKWLINHTFDLLNAKEYQIAANVLEFAVNEPSISKKMDETSSLVCTINLCTSLRELGHFDKS